MPALVIGGVTIRGAVEASVSVTEAIDRVRSIDNTMLASKLGPEKSSWTIRVTNRTDAEVSAITAALNSAAPVTCSGDILRAGSVACQPELHSVGEPILGTVPLRFNMSFTLWQV